MLRLILILILLSSFTHADDCIDTSDIGQQNNRDEFVSNVGAVLERIAPEQSGFEIVYSGGVAPIGEQSSFLSYEESNQEGKAWHYVLGGIGMAPLALVIGTTIHEGSHALVASALGAEITEFKVVPFYDKDSGNFYFGRTGYNINKDEWDEANELWVSAAPMITDTAFLAACSGAAFSGNTPENNWAKTGMLVLCTLPTVDLINHIQATDDYSDIVKLEKSLAQQTSLSETEARWAIRVPMGAAIGVGVAGLGFMAYDLFGNKEKNNALIGISDLRITPQFSTDYAGLQAGFNF